jgi:peptide/nickel transport system permease protein
MIRILAKRLVSMVLVIIVLTAVVFGLQQLSHTNPVHAYLGANASPSAIAHESKILGYNKPIVEQYLTYVGHLFQGNFGVSLRTRRPVGTDLATYLPATLELTVASLIVALVLGAVLGLAATGRWKGAGVFRVVLVAGASIPSFLLGLVLVLLLSDKVHLFPAIGDSGYTNAPTGPTGVVIIDTLVHGNFAEFADALHHLVLPVLCVALGPAVSIGRVLRGSLESSMGADFVRTARAKGLDERVVLFRHALRNSLSAALSMTGLQVGLMFAGVVVVETVFAWPGIGLYTDQSIPPADFPAIAGVTVVLGIGYVVINTIVDLLQAVVDPRIVAE